MNKEFFLLSIILLSSFAFAATSEAQLFVRNSATIPSSLTAGDRDVILQFDVYHAGTRTYTDISITSEFNAPFEAVKGTTSIPSMNPGVTNTVTLKFNVGDADPGVYTVPVTFLYTDTGTSSTVSVTRDVYLQVSNEPTLELRAISAENVFVGETFVLSFDLENTGQVPASSVQSTISLANTSVVSWIPSTQKTGFIAPMETKSISFTGVISGKAPHGAYAGTLSVVYGGKTLTNTFVLDVLGKPTLEVAGVSTDSEPIPGKKISLSVQLENTGTGDAKSAKVTLKSNAGVSGVLDSYVGTIESEDTGTAVFDITLSKVGVNSIPVVVEYVDETGVKQTFEARIEVFNYEAPSNTGFYAVAALIAAAVLYFVYNRRQKHKSSKGV